MREAQAAQQRLECYRLAVAIMAPDVPSIRAMYTAKAGDDAGIIQGLELAAQLDLMLQRWAELFHERIYGNSMPPAPIARAKGQEVKP